MSFYELCMLKELASKGYDAQSIEKKLIVDKEFRKELYKKYDLVTVSAIEQCISDESRIESDKDYKIYRERVYDIGFIYPDEVIMKEHFKEYGYIQDARLEEQIYYDKTIKDIYHLKHLELMELYKMYSMGYMEAPLSFLELIFPAKMPTKDYFPFIEFDLGTKMILPLTEAEKHECEESDEPQRCLEIISNLEITKFEWQYCIFWIDKDRMFMSLGECSDYYLKQIGKNTHFFTLTYQCV